MGRVYDALKRASAGQTNGSRQRKESGDLTRRNGSASESASPAAKNGVATAGEHPWDRSPLFVARDAARDSASTAHPDATAGSALPGGLSSRAAGATLDAAGSTRDVVEFVSQDISATRVEPHF